MRGFKLQYVSDIHLENKGVSFPRIPIKGQVLALLGDIGNPYNQNYIDFLLYTSYNFEKVILVAGNHDYNFAWKKHKSLEYCIADFENIVSKFGNIEFLDNKKTRINNYTVLGTTLWTNRYSGNRYFDSTNWLQSELSLINSPVIVLSHHLPTFKMIVSKYKTNKFNSTRDFFASNLDHLIKDPVKIWLCGHSHCTTQININNVICGINTNASLATVIHCT
jgi:hypothetical protein